MPFIVTEPQKIEGTTLGYAIYPYTFSFQDRFENASQLSQKLLFFRMKDTPFNEIDRVVFEKTYEVEKVSSNLLDATIINFVKAHPEFVKSYTKFNQFVHRIEESKKFIVK